MKCKVCGAESGKYPLCRDCNAKKEAGEIIKCNMCGNWHYKYQSCTQQTLNTDISSDIFLYEAKQTLITQSEQSFFAAIKNSVPEDHLVFPQINLASFINRTDDSRYRNELFRNVDFLITDSGYHPKIVIEINDKSHLTHERRERDEKVKNICEEAGIPIITLWTSYGTNNGYIKHRIDEILSAPPTKRVHHFTSQKTDTAKETVRSVDYIQPVNYTPPVKKQGCYIATCVYGSYNCPQVWTLRRYRDYKLSTVWYGKLFIKLYYTVSPIIVKYAVDNRYFRSFWKKILDKMVWHLNKSGYEDLPYNDINY